MKHRVNSINKVGMVNSDGHVIGLDIGATAVRAAVLAPGLHDGRPSVTVHGLGAAPLPEGAVVNGAVVNPQAVTAAIRQLWLDAKLRDSKVVLGLANQQLVVRDLAMPDLPQQQLRAALPFQARELVALPVDQALIDFCPVGPADPATHMVPGLLIAAPRKPVVTAVEAVENAGLQVARVDLAALAALRATASMTQGAEMVVDIGAQLTSIVIHQHGIPKVVRIIGHGSGTVTDRLADRLGMTLEDAEEAKRTIGVTGDSEIARVIRDTMRQLMSEIRGSVHLFSTAAPGTSIGQIGLTGGGAAVPGLAAALSDQHDAPAAVVTPLQHVRNRFAARDAESGTEDEAATAVSIGLAMGAAA